MKGNPSDWEYEKPSYDTIMMLVIWHFQLQFCSVGESLCQTPHWHFQRQKSFHIAEGLTVSLAKVLSDFNSGSNRYTYTETQIL